MLRKGWANLSQLRIKANEGAFKIKRLKDKFINGINNGDMITEIIQELTMNRKISKISSEQVLSWPEGWKCKEYKKHS